MKAEAYHANGINFSGILFGLRWSGPAPNLFIKQNESKYGTERATVEERTKIASKVALFSAYLAYLLAYSLN